jgi:hypothetical protein
VGLWGTYHYRSAGPLDIGCHGVNLGAKGRSNERGNILVPGKLAEGEHNSRVGRLVIFDDELNWSAEQTTRLVYLLNSELGTLNLVKAGLGQRSRDRSYHADFERLCGAPETGEHGNIPAKTILQLVIAFSMLVYRWGI